MADEEDQKVLEEQLESQLHEQRDSLSALDDALVSDPSNPELVAVREELINAIEDVEKGLLHLKRARLLREFDSSVQDLKPPAEEDVKAETLDGSEGEAEPLEEQSYSIGSKCRFRHTDGRWYDGLVVGLDGCRSARLSFLTPTSESMLMCKFFLQNRCRFGNNCRLSHGVDVPLSSLKKYISTIWDQSLAGSSIWALSDGNSGIWKEAELESWDERQEAANVVFRDDGSLQKLGRDAISLSEYAQMSDDEESYSDSDDSELSESSDYEEGSSQGIGFLESTTMQRGIQTETAIFAKWENHTRGIASKMMANMGFREGMGLGVSGQGMVNPIPVKVLPARQSLDHAVENREKEEIKEHRGKKRSRGGKKKRDRKLAAAAARAAEDQEESRPDMFSFINTQLAIQGQVHASKKKSMEENVEKKKEEDRRALIAYDDQIKELKTRVQKLEEMVSRNRKEKLVYEAAMRKLVETRKALADAEVAHASTSNAVSRKEKEKRWLKF